ncbi:MAG: response regulator, partial [Planctomycetota bacterium]|nr:response regulator [Planctomycetota bacterium]
MNSRRHILVIEDDPNIQRAVVDTLATGAYRTSCASDGRQGLETALSLEPDLVLLDIMLPGLDGFEVLAELRRARPSLPIIMVTAKG